MNRPNSHHIRRCRQKRAMTTTEFAALVGVSESTVRSWENGKRKPHGLQLKSLLAAMENVAADQ